MPFVTALNFIVVLFFPFLSSLSSCNVPIIFLFTLQLSLINPLYASTTQNENQSSQKNDISRAIFPSLPGFRGGTVADREAMLFESGEGEEGAQQAFEVGDTLALIAEVRQSVETHRANKDLPLGERVKLMEEEKRRLQVMDATPCLHTLFTYHCFV